MVTPNRKRRNAEILHGYDELAAYLRIPEQTVRNNKAWSIPRLTEFRRLAFRRADVDAWLDSRVVEVEHDGTVDVVLVRQAG
jgi:hypothetical protein